ncbi:unannotated protein [freshwater metagenome]|uniref:Unannotated protein n=1 Tax=freshwater metagenome TaxID=449393 RepID=A0A6J7EX93_9ZZZZ
MSSASSLNSPSGYSTGPSGSSLIICSVSTSTFRPDTDDTGTTSAQAQPSSSASAPTSLSRSIRVSLFTRSALVTITMIGVRPSETISLAMNRSPGPISWSAGRHSPITSTLAQASRTDALSRSPSRVRGRCSPGVSTRINCASSVVRMPRMSLRVVCGRSEVIATL